MDFAIELWSSLFEIFLDIGPYILLGLLIAGVLRILLPDRAVARLLGRDAWWESPVASLVGVPLPLCSCSVLPFAFGLRRQGAGKGAVTAFLTSTPQTGVDSILVAYSFFGLPFALFKVAVSFVMGTVSGWLVGLIGDRDGESPDGAEQQNRTDEICGCGCDSGSESGRCGDEWEGPAPSRNGASKKKAERRSPWTVTKSTFSYAYDELLGDFALTLLLGIIASAAVTALVPEDLFGRFELQWVSYPAVLLLSVPLYICATSSVPLAFSLVAIGLPPGAAMVLLIAGPATNIATIGIVASILGKRSAAVYTVTIIVFALAGGILFDSFLSASEAGPTVAEPLEFPYSVRLVSAVILAAMLVYHTVRKIRKRMGGGK